MRLLRVKRAAPLAIAAIVAILMGGCAGIPRSGPVTAAHVNSVPSDIDVILLPDGPVAGESQEQILNGFIRAGASPQNDYAVARQFLSQSFSRTWDPNARTTVDTTGDRPAPLRSSDSRLTQTVTPVAEVNAAGSYRELTQSQLPLPYDFVMENGEWRISGAPDGILLDQFRFNQVFDSYSVYFYDPTFTYLVPDLRWFPRLAATGTRIVRALLAGPATWLQGAVVSAFPESTQITAVVVQAGQANVDLSSNVLEADPVTRYRMAAQLRTSLYSLTGVSTVQMMVNQSPVPVPEGIVTAPIVDPRVDARPLVMQGGVFGFITDAGITAVPELSDHVQALDPAAAVYASGQRIVATLNASGVAIVGPGTDPVYVDNRARLIAPTIDTRGFVWSVPADAPGEIRVHSHNGAGSPVATGWQDASGIRALEVSRDGTRVLALLAVGSQAKLVVAGVIRDSNGVPQRLGPPTELATGIGNGLDATWVDDDQVASLTRAPTGDSTVTLQELGGQSRSLGSPAAGTTMAGGNAVDGLRVRDTTGQLLQARGASWQPTGVSASMLAKQY